MHIRAANFFVRWLFPLVVGFGIGSGLGYLMGYSHLGAEMRGERGPTLVTRWIYPDR